MYIYCIYIYIQSIIFIFKYIYVYIVYIYIYRESSMATRNAGPVSSTMSFGPATTSGQVKPLVAPGKTSLQMMNKLGVTASASQ